MDVTSPVPRSQPDQNATASAPHDNTAISECLYMEQNALETLK